jgi:hypothetical protein
MVYEPTLCTRCHAEVHPIWRFCSHCGSKLEQSSIGAGAPPGDVASSAQATEGVAVCDNCGAAVDTTGAFCWQCGVPLSTGREPFIPEDLETETSPVAVAILQDREEASSRSRPSRSAFVVTDRSRRSRRSLVGGGVLLVGAGIAVLSLLLGWYGVVVTVSAPYNGGTITVTETGTNFLLVQSTTLVTCQGSSQCPANQSASEGYAQGGAKDLGTYYDALAALMIGGLLLAAVSAAYAMRGPNKARVSSALALFSVVLLLLAPVVMLGTQPAVLRYIDPTASSPGPASAFFGSCTGAGCGISPPSGYSIGATWGPFIGWYVGLIAGVFVLAGFLLVRRGDLRPRGKSIYDEQLGISK